MLTPEQIVILKNYANTVQELVDAMAAGDDGAVMAHFNNPTAEYGWRSYIEPEEYLSVMDWTEVDNLTVGRARIWEWITSQQTTPLNAAQANIRAGLANAFQGNGAVNTRNGLLAIATRLMTKAEQLLVDVSAGGAGTSTNAKTMTFEGNITFADASLIRVSGD